MAIAQRQRRGHRALVSARASIAASDTPSSRGASTPRNKRRHALVRRGFLSISFRNCSRVTIRLACSIVVAGGDAFDVDDSIDPTPDVFRSSSSDATTISQFSDNVFVHARARLATDSPRRHLWP